MYHGTTIGLVVGGATAWAITASVVGAGVIITQGLTQSRSDDGVVQGRRIRGPGGSGGAASRGGDGGAASRGRITGSAEKVLEEIVFGAEGRTAYARVSAARLTVHVQEGGYQFGEGIGGIGRGRPFVL